MAERIEIVNARMADSGAPLSVRLDGEQIEWVGPPEDMPNDANITRRIDAQGQVLLPGFCDSHLHLFWGGVTLDQLDMLQITDREAATSALRAFASQHPDEQLLCAFSANYTFLGAGTRPDRHALDAIVPDRAFLIMAVDGHTAWANSAALELAGLTDAVPHLRGAEVVCDASGAPTGELREGGAMDLVQRFAANGGREGICMAGDEPAASASDRARDKATLRRALATCASYGITTAVNMDGNLYQASLLGEMAQAGELPIRVSLPMRIAPHHDAARIAALIEAAQQPPIGKLSFGRIKMFMDGVFDSWTAYRTDDYPGREGDRGAPLFTPEQFNAICCQADAAGLQIQVHCVGDAAVRATLDGYQAAQQANGARDARHRIEHIDLLHPDDLERFSRLGVVASMQPVHPPGSSGLPLEPTVSIIGRNRWGDTFPWAALHHAGVPLAFGTDWPTAPLSPFNAIHAALSRQPWAPDCPDQRLPLSEVLRAYTAGGAYAIFADGVRGHLAPAQQADLVLLSQDPHDLALDAATCHATLTICAGDIIHEVSR